MAPPRAVRRAAASITSATGVVALVAVVLVGGVGARPAAAATGDIATVAGNGTSSFVDGAAATSTGVGAVGGIAADDLGDVFATSTDLHRVVMLDGASNVVDLVAGTGSAGFAGDGGLARSAQLNGPTGVAYDSTRGAVVVADTGNHRLRRVLLGGTRAISTIAGTGTAGFSGDGGAATSAALSGPTGVAVAADGTVYVADTGNNRVRAISPSGTISTVAGTGTAGSTGDGGAATAATLDQPVAVLVDAAGTVWIAERAGAVVRSVSGGVIARRAGVVGSSCATPNGDGGAATSASLCAPVGLAARGDGSLAVAEAATGKRVRAVAGVVPFPPGAVSSLTVTGGVGTITVNWSPPAVTGGLPVLDYRVQVLLGGTTATQTVTGTSATFSGLSAGLAYNVSLWPRNAAGLGTEAQGVGSPSSDPPVSTTAAPTTTTTAAPAPPTTGAPVPGGTGGSGTGGLGAGGSGTGAGDAGSTGGTGTGTGAGATGTGQSATGFQVGDEATGHGATVGMAAPTGTDTAVLGVLAGVSVAVGTALVAAVVRRRRAAATPPPPWI